MRRLSGVVVGLSMLAGIAAGAGPAAGAVTERVSVSSTGEQSNDSTGDWYLGRPVISANGRYVAFESFASNLVPADTNGTPDVFVRDLVAGTTERVSVSSAGEQANDSSDGPAISADGRFVAFSSWASNLVPGGSGGEEIFVRDRVTETTELVSMSSAGEQGNDKSRDPAISADGGVVAFISRASNLARGDYFMNWDVFVRNRATGRTELASVSSSGNHGTKDSYDVALSADGRLVAFDSSQSRLVPGDTNRATDVFVRNRAAGTTRRVDVSSTGRQADGAGLEAISGDGRFVVFSSSAPNLVAGDTNRDSDIFVRNRGAGTTRRVSLSSAARQANDGSWEAEISANGRFLVFMSVASNLVAHDTNAYRDVFVCDRANGTTRRISVSTAGTQGNGASGQPTISGNGRIVAFKSKASNLVDGDSNNTFDAFVRIRRIPS